MAANVPRRAITPTSPSPSPSPRQSNTGLPLQFASTTSAVHSAPLPIPNPALDMRQSPPSEEERIRINLENRVRAIVDILYQLAVCTADVQEGSEALVGGKINETVRALAELDATKSDLKAMIPEDVIELLDDGRNPDIHSRNFVVRLAAENQYSYGQHEAMQEYNSKLTSALHRAFPALATDPSKQ